MATCCSRFDISRSAPNVPRVARQAICSSSPHRHEEDGPVLRLLYDQMPEPKWSFRWAPVRTPGDRFPTYSVLQGVDKIVPVDVYVSGCPPRPEALLYGLMRLQDKIRRESTVLRKERVIRAGETGPTLVRAPASVEG